jgi:hypothetical protein
MKQKETVRTKKFLTGHFKVIYFSQVEQFKPKYSLSL